MTTFNDDVGDVLREFYPPSECPTKGPRQASTSRHRSAGVSRRRSSRSYDPLSAMTLPVANCVNVAGSLMIWQPA